MSEEDDQQGAVSVVATNAWTGLRQLTQARVALGHAGTSLPTEALLAFQLDHARAVDAVHQSLDTEKLQQALMASDSLGLADHGRPMVVASEAGDSVTYLQRPDLGRRLLERDYQRLQEASERSDQPFDLAIVIAGGLSASAARDHALPVLEALVMGFKEQGQRVNLAPIVLARHARVALGDDVGESLGARLVLVLIGERPGLTSPDSLGAYLTWRPKRGMLDSQRNCISNIRPQGLSYRQAAEKALYLMGEAMRIKQTGIELKDRAGTNALEQGPASDEARRFQLTGGAAGGVGET